MWLTKISLKNPAGTVLILILMIALGVIALPRIPVSFWPDFEAPTIIVLTNYPGASPELIESEIAEPLEKELSLLQDVEEIETSCMEGFCRIYVRFKWGVDFEQAKINVQERVNRARAFFPREASNPEVLQVQDFLPPEMLLGFYSKSRDLMEIKEFVEGKVISELLRAEGVASVELIGGYEREIEVKVNLQRLHQYGISFDHLFRILQERSRNLLAGEIESSRKEYPLYIRGKFAGKDEIGGMIIGVVARTPIYLKDVAKIDFVPAADRIYSRRNGKEVVVVSIRKQSGGNTMVVCSAVRERLKSIQKRLPADIQLAIIDDQSIFIRKAIGNVLINVGIGALLAAVVIFAFLGNLTNFLVIAVSIPVSVLFTFFFIWISGLSLNTISLGGLALGVGLIVDSSVVVAENIFRHFQIKSSVDRPELVLNATGEVGGAVIASTLTTLVVFFPMVFLVGLFAVLLGELALTIVFALSIAMLVSLTIVPYLASRFMRVKSKDVDFENSSVMTGWLSRFDRLKAIYAATLERSLRYPFLIILVAFGILVFTLCFPTRFLDLELMPTVNEDEFLVDLQFPEGTKLTVTDENTRQIERYLLSLPEVEQVYTQVGLMSARGERKDNYAHLRVDVTPRGKGDIAQIMNQVSTYSQRIPASRIIVRQQDVTSGFQREPVNIRVFGEDLDLLAKYGKQVEALLREIPGISNLFSNMRQIRFHYEYEPDYYFRSLYRIDLRSAEKLLQSALDGVVVTKVPYRSKDLNLRLKVDTDSQITPEELLNLSILSPEGIEIPLYRLFKPVFKSSPIEIKRMNQQRFVAVSADIMGHSRRSTMREVKAKLQELNLPDGYCLTYAGQSRGITDSLKSLTTALIISLFLVYLVMGIQFNSFLYPLIIGITIPLAIIGVVYGLLIFGVPVSMNAMLGMLLLVGIVVNNGIIMIDYINQLRQRGLDLISAIVNGASDRLRPVLMTALTTILAIMPLAIGIGSGGEALRPLGAVVVGGLTVSTLLTFFVFPAFYYVIARRSERRRKEAIPEQEIPDGDSPILPLV